MAGTFYRALARRVSTPLATHTLVAFDDDAAQPGGQCDRQCHADGPITIAVASARPVLDGHRP